MELSILDRKDSLIHTAIEVLNDHGIRGLSTREIAKREGVSEATLFRYYKTKNDLLLAMLDFESKYDSDIMKSVKVKKINPRAAIIYFMNSFAEYYENYPAITAISQAYDVLASEPLLADKIKKSFSTRIGFLHGLLLEAQRAGEINKNVDCEKISFLIWGSFMSICLNWRFNKFNFKLKEYTLSTLDMTLGAFEIK